MSLALCLLLLGLPAAVQASGSLFDSGSRETLELPPPPETRPASAPPNVILITLDGVRWQEFLGNRPDAKLSTDTAATFPAFWGGRAAQGVVLERLFIANPVVLSLPAYQSIMAGAPQACFSNECDRIKVETLPERLRRELALPKKDVASVLSWPGIERAVRSKPDSVEVDASSATRPDAETWARALETLRGRPRFLYIAFNDADDRGHKGDYPGYLAALRRYDAWLERLFAELAAMGDYGSSTTVLLTTDHGRGTDRDWTSHGGRPAATRVWLYARGPHIPASGRLGTSGSHVQIRPSIETLMGLEPSGDLLPGLSTL